MERRNNNHVRYRYGICLSDDCEKSKSKEIQQLSARKDFVCEQCGKPLRECPPPKKKNYLPIIVAISVLAVVSAMALYIFSDNRQHSMPTAPQTVVSDTAAVKKDTSKRDTAESGIMVAKTGNKGVETSPQQKAKESMPKKTENAASFSKNLGYAIFKGSFKNGEPDDVNGRLVFKTSHIIDSRDPKGRIADTGDYVIGEFSEGHLVQGIWYGADNTVKGSIIIGK